MTAIRNRTRDNLKDVYDKAYLGTHTGVSYYRSYKYEELI